MTCLHERTCPRSRRLLQAAMCVAVGAGVFGVTARNAWAGQEPDEEADALSQQLDQTPAPINNRNQQQVGQNQTQTAPNQTNAANDLDQKSGALGVTLAQERDGVRVIDLLPGGPAARAGLQVGDQLKAIDGTKWTTVDDVIEQISARWPNTNVRLEIDRQGTTRTMDALLASRAAIIHDERSQQQQFQQQQFGPPQQFGQQQQFVQHAPMPPIQGQQFAGQFNGPMTQQSFSFDPHHHHFVQQQHFAHQQFAQQQCFDAQLNQLRQEVQALREEVRVLRGVPVNDPTQTAQSQTVNVQQ